MSEESGFDFELAQSRKNLTVFEMVWIRLHYKQAVGTFHQGPEDASSSTRMLLRIPSISGVGRTERPGSSASP